MTASYTQTSVAFPNNPKRAHVIDELGVHLDDTGSEFYFRWHELGPRYPHGALRVECFADGIRALQRVLPVVLALEHEGDVSPQRVIEMLEAVGVTPSHYHLNVIR